MWTLILTLIIAGHSVYTITIPNLTSREVCKQAGENHIEQYTHKFNKLFDSGKHFGFYTCVETLSN